MKHLNSACLSLADPKIIFHSEIFKNIFHCAFRTCCLLKLSKLRAHCCMGVMGGEVASCSAVMPSQCCLTTNSIGELQTFTFLFVIFVAYHL